LNIPKNETPATMVASVFLIIKSYSAIFGINIFNLAKDEL